ncbi:MAG: FAD-binding oxidoreductase [Acidimicrobiales bacterium]
MTNSNLMCDALVIGGGIGGVSIAFELAADRKVCLVESESTLAFHTTGRSAATFVETYGNLPIRALTASSRSFFTSPSDLFEFPLASPRGVLHVTREQDDDVARKLFDEVRTLSTSAELVGGRDAERLNPLLRPGYTAFAVYEPDGMDLDVAELHQGYVRGLQRRGGVISRSAQVASATRDGAIWLITDSSGSQYRAPLVVNAAGAWCDDVARLLGATPVGIRPLRRTIFTVLAIDEIGGEIPMTIDEARSFYIKPEKFQYLCSPGDETLQPACDVQVDPLDVAIGLDLINEATIMNARHVRASWAGLRSFVFDRTPVVGFDEEIAGLLWMAAQGGYGIQIAPSLAKFAASTVRGTPVPSELLERGFQASALSPARFKGLKD